jgi:hypothetical protein
MALNFQPYPYNPPPRDYSDITTPIFQAGNMIQNAIQEQRRNKYQETLDELARNRDVREAQEQLWKGRQMDTEYGVRAPSEAVNPISGPMTWDQSLRSTLSPTSPAAQPANQPAGGMVSRFRQWQDQNRAGPRAQPMGMPQAEVGYNEFLPQVTGYTPEMVRSMGGSGYSTLGTKRMGEMKTLFGQKETDPNSLDALLAQRVRSGQMTLEQAFELKKNSQIPSFQLAGTQEGQPVFFNPKTTEMMAGRFPGKGPLMSTTQSEGQANAGLFASRMEEANKQLENISSQVDLTSASSGAMGKAPNFAKSKEIQMFEQSKRNFINAVLRRESGAVISPTEFEEGNKQYFPVFGDSNEVVQQKALNRKTALAGLRNAAGFPQRDDSNSSQSTSSEMKVINGRRYVKQNGQWYEQ